MSPVIVPATDALLDQVEKWLEIEDAAYRHASAMQSKNWELDIDVPWQGFLCNWPSVRRSFSQDQANVHVLMSDGMPVGFLDRMDIVEIQPDQRGRGFGRVLAEFMLQKAFDEGRSVAEIGIAPPTAVPFWKAMGFTADETRQSPSGIYAFRRFDRRQSLGPRTRVAYRIAFYEPARDWDKTVEPFEEFLGEGELLADGSIVLPQRAYCFDVRGETSNDCVVRVEAAGASLYEDKVKRPAARDVGMQFDAGDIYFFDRILSNA